MAGVSAAVWIVEIYALLGVLFAAFFVTRGVGRIDPGARGAGVGFRLLIVPGAIAFWPLLLRRVVAGRGQPPVESNPHRAVAREHGDGGGGT